MFTYFCDNATICNCKGDDFLAMTQTERTKKYQAKCDAITIRPPLEHGQAIRAAADQAGQSVTAYILEAVRDIYSWAKKDIQTDVPVCYCVETLQLPKRKITDEEKQWCEDTWA